MKALCVIAMIGQGLIVAYCVMVLILFANVGLASASDLLIAILVPVISGLTLFVLFKAAPFFDEERKA